MVLRAVIRDLLRGGSEAEATKPRDDRPVVLNVGGNTKQIPIPPYYNGWQHWLLDVDAAARPDIVCDAREMTKLPAASCDAVYCSHNLEHYYRHDASRVLAGFLHVLKPAGFADIRVPDLKCVMDHVVAKGMDLEDVLYVSPGGPILVRDVIYGWSKQIEQSGKDFYAHRTGFTPPSLRAILSDAGFGHVHITERKELFEVGAYAFKQAPSVAQRTLLGL